MQRAQNLLAQMTAAEKFAMVAGNQSLGSYAGQILNNSRLGIPQLHLEDGPQGVGDGTTNVTAWPSALTVVATWDTDLMYLFGAAMGAEQRVKGTNIMLGPMTNIARVPEDGRNFESFGEDPHLSSMMITSSVLGIQSNNIMACAKHYVDNNQETNRTTVSENVPQRAQMEIYYPAFEAAVSAGVAAIMCSYNRINNTWACENNQTLNTDLKGRFGYQGFVMSDWGATHSTVESANAGLDMEMPDNYYFGEALQQAVASGNVSMDRIDDMVLRILYSMFYVGLFDNPQTGNLSSEMPPELSMQHAQLARQLAATATVLLKNTNNLLPIDFSKVGSIAVLGNDGNLTSHISAVGNGSGHVIPPYVITPLQGIQEAAQSSGYNVDVSYAPTNPISTAVQLAASSDIAIVFVSVDSSEGIDRVNLSLPYPQDELVQEVLNAQPNTIVVLHIAGAVLMPWVDSATAILSAFLPGQEDGYAIADVLFGNVNPSARLPITFPLYNNQTDCSTIAQWPGINNEANYSEDIFVGYRYYDQYNLDPLFPFGHGLSYTTFQYSDLNISNYLGGDVNVSFTVTNNGTIAGNEVAQFYLGYPPEVGEPPKVLKGFEKTAALNPGTNQTIQFTLQPGYMSYWNTTLQTWVQPSGTFMVYVGASSRDIRLTGSFELP